MRTCEPLAIAGQPRLCGSRRGKGALEPGPRPGRELRERGPPTQVTRRLFGQVIRGEGEHEQGRTSRRRLTKAPTPPIRMNGVRALCPTSASRSRSAFTSSTTSWTISCGDSGIRGILPVAHDLNHANSQLDHRNATYGVHAMTDDTFTRRTTLAKLGGVVLAAAGGGSPAPGRGRPRAGTGPSRKRRRRLRADAGTDRSVPTTSRARSSAATSARAIPARVFRSVCAC